MKTETQQDPIRYPYATPIGAQCGANTVWHVALAPDRVRIVLAPDSGTALAMAQDGRCINFKKTHANAH